MAKNVGGYCYCCLPTAAESKLRNSVLYYRLWNVNPDAWRVNLDDWNINPDALATPVKLDRRRRTLERRV